MILLLSIQSPSFRILLRSILSSKAPVFKGFDLGFCYDIILVFFILFRNTLEAKGLSFYTLVLLSFWLYSNFLAYLRLSHRQLFIPSISNPVTRIWRRPKGGTSLKCLDHRRSPMFALFTQTIYIYMRWALNPRLIAMLIMFWFVKHCSRFFPKLAFYPTDQPLLSIAFLVATEHAGL